MLSESAKARIDEAAEKNMQFPKKCEPGCYQTLMIYEVNDYTYESFKDGATFGYTLAIEEQVNTHPTVTRLKIELLKAQEENARLKEKLEIAVKAFYSIDPNISNKDVSNAARKIINNITSKALEQIKDGI